MWDSHVVTFHLVKLQREKVAALPGNGTLTDGRKQLPFIMAGSEPDICICTVMHGRTPRFRVGLEED